MEKEKLVERIDIRVSRQEKNMIKMLAGLYAGGNISAYIVDRVLYSNRRLIKESNFDLSKRRVSRSSPTSQKKESN